MAREQDHYTRKAFQEGYPARSVYKLQEIDRRFNVIRKNDVVLDVGASPGSWSMYAFRKTNNRARVVGVDIQNQSPNLSKSNFAFIKGDIFSKDVFAEVSRLGPYTCILSDAAPSTTGNRTVDTAKSYSIVERVLELVDLQLKPGGRIVVKVFQGGDENVFLSKLRQDFASARFFKPSASRKGSFEVFLVATGYRNRQ